jgi:PTH1 family peptidyl-tRNA hydrolase
MCLIIGLGNPGKKYERTRHNVGFLVLDELAALTNGKFKKQNEIRGETAKVTINNRPVELLRPGTFMNLSGEAVAAAAKKWRLPRKKITIILDDVNLPLGETRVRESGSAGGHNGLKSVIEKMKTDEIRRIRLGTGRPLHSTQALDKWVLEKFNKEEWKAVVEAARQIAQQIATGKIFIG